MPHWSPWHDARNVAESMLKLSIHVRSASKQEPAETRTACVGSGMRKKSNWKQKDWPRAKTRAAAGCPHSIRRRIGIPFDSLGGPWAPSTCAIRNSEELSTDPNRTQIFLPSVASLNKHPIAGDPQLLSQRLRANTTAENTGPRPTTAVDPGRDQVDDVTQ